MPSILRFLDDGTVELRRAFERTPEIQRLLKADLALGEYRRLLERLRRGFAVVELYAFDDLPDVYHQTLRAHRSTWRLSHDIGILGGTAPLPARREDMENAGTMASASAKLGAHFALALILETLARGRQPLLDRFGSELLSCLLFNTGRKQAVRRFSTAVAQLIEHQGSNLDWAEALTGARCTLRTIRGAMSEPATA
jgi:hypothetical protein